MRISEVAFERRARREGYEAVSTAHAWRRLLLALLALAAASCGGGSGSQPDPTPTSAPTTTPTATAAPPTDTPEPTATPVAAGFDCEARPDPHCGHPINDIVVPLLRSIGEQPRDAAPEEICRRLAVDLLGRIPSEAERAECAGRPLADTIDAWMQTTEYAEVQHRFWASELGYNAGRTIWWQIFDLDEIVDLLVHGEIAYDEFATLVVTHPAFVVPRFDDGWGAGVFLVFLGRPPRRDEMDGTRPLASVFGQRKICDGRAAEFFYANCAAQQPDPQSEDPMCLRVCHVRNWEGGIDPCGCAEVAGGAGCYGTGFGEPIDLGVNDCRPGADLQRLIDATAGDTDRCPELPQTCADLHVPFDDNNILTGPPAVPLPEISDGVRRELRNLGAVLAERGDFWETAADRELKRLLGWWQSGFRQPEFDIPEVRALLGEHLRAGADLRAIQKLILTSLLYTAPAAAPAGLAGSPASPPWCSGPLKALVGESWVASAQLVVGEVLGLCDYRFIAPGQVQGDIMKALTGQGRSLDSTLEIDDEIVPGPDAEAQRQQLLNYLSLTNLSRLLDGCGFDPRPRAATLNVVSRQAEIANALCALGRGVLPAGSDPSDASEPALRAAAEHLLERALSRLPEAATVEATAVEMRDCIDAGDCAGAEDAARWLCARLLDSTAFALY